MRILHTSDWHLGRALYGRKRYREFAALLDWLAATLERERVELLLIAGDLFDSGTPSNRAQELYYRFLHRVAGAACRHVVVIGGNHDSPSFLEAPRALLRTLQVHVVGAAAADPAEEVLLLRDPAGEVELILCAVPYLRDREIRSAEAGESASEKSDKLLRGIRSHYAAVGEVALARRQALAAELGREVPIVGMGHLFTSGGTTLADDGVRELYVGSLTRVEAAAFPSCFDYLALGHLHQAQRVAGSEAMRYSGAPLPFSFGEAEREKCVLLVEFTAASPGERSPLRVQRLPVPSFQRLARLRGDWPRIEAGLRELRTTGESIWLEVIYDGEELVGDLRERLEQVVEGSPLEILRVQNRRVFERVLEQLQEEETLEQLSSEDVFVRCLQAHEVPEAQREALWAAYREVLQSLADDDPGAE
jgi:exonuclease SbcD